MDYNDPNLVRNMNYIEKEIKNRINFIMDADYHFLNDAYTDRFFEQLGEKLDGKFEPEQLAILKIELDDYFNLEEVR